MLRLAPFRRSDVATVASWFSSEAEAAQWGGAGMRYPVEPQLAAILEETAGSPPARLAWMARREDRTVGHAELGLDWVNGVARLGRVGLAPDARGKGLAKPMLRLVLDQAFAIPDIQRVDLQVYTFNTRASRTYEAMGFVREGVMRSCARVGSERWDAILMSMLRPEWLALRG